MSFFEKKSVFKETRTNATLTTTIKKEQKRGEDEKSAEKAADGGEKRCFVGFGREVRRYLFQTHSSEIECDGCEILVRGEW